MKIVNLAAGLALVALPLTATLAVGQNAPIGTVTEAQQFADTAASSNTFEIESSQLALERSQNDDVIAFAEQMIRDHTAAGEQMMAAAEQDGITPAAEMMEKHRMMLDELAAAEDVQFDEAYVEMQVLAHDEAVALFEGYSMSGEEGALKAFASETLSVLQQHQDHAHRLAES